MARRPRGPMTTLGEMRRKEPTCSVCGQGFTSGQPVAWTVGRDRIHESCIEVARVTTPGRAKFGPWKAPAVHAFLQGGLDFMGIPAVIETVLEQLPAAQVHSFDTLYRADAEARRLAAEAIGVRA